MAAGRGNLSKECHSNGINMDTSREKKHVNGHINGKTKNGINGKNGKHEPVSSKSKVVCYIFKTKI